MSQTAEGFKASDVASDGHMKGATCDALLIECPRREPVAIYSGAGVGITLQVLHRSAGEVVIGVRSRRDVVWSEFEISRLEQEDSLTTFQRDPLQPIALQAVTDKPMFIAPVRPGLCTIGPSESAESD